MIYCHLVSRLHIFWNRTGKTDWDSKGKYSSQFPKDCKLQTLTEATSTCWNSHVMTETLTEIKVFFVDAESFQTFPHLIAPAVWCRTSINQMCNKTTCTTGWVQINREWFHANQLVQRWGPLRCNRRLPFTIKVNTNIRKLWHSQELTAAYVLKISIILVTSVNSSPMAKASYWVLCRAQPYTVFSKSNFNTFHPSMLTTSKWPLPFRFSDYVKCSCISMYHVFCKSSVIPPLHHSPHTHRQRLQFTKLSNMHCSSSLCPSWYQIILATFQTHTTSSLFSLICQMEISFLLFLWDSNFIKTN